MIRRVTHSTTEGWRIRRRRSDRRLRPRRALIVGTGPAALQAARELAGAGCAEVVLSVPTRGGALSAAGTLGGVARVLVGLDEAAPADVLIVCDEGHGTFAPGGGAGSAALWAARHAPDAVLILLAVDGPAACGEALRRSGLPPWSILAPGGMPLAATVRARLARRLGVDACQIAAPVIGGGKAGMRPLPRYTTIAGIPLHEPCLGAGGSGAEAAPATEPAALVSAGVELARAVLQDRREVHSCCAWVEGRFGIAGAFVTLPVPVGARGAEDPLPLRLSLEERALLQRAAPA